MFEGGPETLALGCIQAAHDDPRIADVLLRQKVLLCPWQQSPIPGVQRESSWLVKAGLATLMSFDDQIALAGDVIDSFAARI